MDQFNRNTYKKETLFQQFYHSCLGKVIILAVVGIILFIVAAMTVPTDEKMRFETNDNVHQCLQDNDSIKSDGIDEFFQNIGRTCSHADTTLTNREVYDAYKKYNKMEVYRHNIFATTYLRNTLNTQGVRVGIGVFGFVISTVRYTDLVLDIGPARGDYNKKLIPDVVIPDEYIGDNPNLKPYHYKGNPDD